MFIRNIFLLLVGVAIIQNSKAQNLDRNLKPSPGPAPVIQLKDPYIYILDNGLTLLVVEDHRLPKVSANLEIDAGPITEGKKAGVMQILGGMLNEGTTTLPKAAFDEAVEKLGANVNLRSSGSSVSSLTRYFENAFSLMTQALEHPAFPQESFDKLKTQSITSLKADEKSAASISSKVTNALAFGKTHPEGEFETEKSIQDLTLGDVKQVYNQYITPSRAYLTIVGDIDPMAAKALVLKTLGTWKGVALVLPKLNPVLNVQKTEIDVIDLPSAVQSEIKLVNLLELKKGDPDFFAASLANYILGGGAESHLFMNLREKHGFTYGAYSNLGTGRFQTTFIAAASVRTAKTDSAVMEFTHEIHRIRTDKVTDEELSVAKALYNGSFALSLEDPARTATLASTVLINHLPADYYKTYLQKFNAVTPEDILRVAKKYMGDPIRIVVVGNTSKMLESLQKLGYPIKLYDAMASPLAAQTKSATTTVISAKDIIKNYIDAVGGAAELKKVTAYQTNMTMAMQGMTLNVVQKKMAPNKEAMSITMGGNTVMKTAFDGTKGYQIQGSNKKEMTPEEVNQKKVFTSLTEQVDYLNNPAFKLENKGIQKVEGSDAYQIQVTDPSGKTSTEYYNVKSKLLVKNESAAQNGPNTVLTTVLYGDYRAVGTVKFPYKESFSISAGGHEQNFTMNVTEISLNPSSLKNEDFN